MSDIKVFSKNNGVAIVTPTSRTWFADPDGDFVAEAGALSTQVNIKRDVDSFYIYKNLDYTKIKDSAGSQIGTSRDNCVSVLNSDYFNRTSKIQEIDNVSFQNTITAGQVLKFVDIGSGILRISNESEQDVVAELVAATAISAGDKTTIQTNLGVDPSGTDNSTDVTLAGAYDYITIVGQTITRGQVDYTTDISNTPTIPSGDLVDDTTPQLGGDLDVNGQKIVSTSNGDIIIEPNGTGNVGIGITSPTEKLHVVGRARILDSGSNTLIGSSWGSISTASNNAGIGNQALSSISTGQLNTAVGTQAGLSISTGNYNVAIGHVAGKKITTQEYTVAVGFGAGQFVAPSSSISLNTLVGTLAGNGVDGFSTYVANTAVGYRALLSATTGGSNTAIGAESGYKLTSGGTNTALGRRSFYYNTTGSSNVAIGYEASFGQNGLSTFSNTVAIGYQAAYSTTTGAGGVSIGYHAGYSATTSLGNAFMGYQAGKYATGGLNVAIGYQALLGVSGSSAQSGIVAIGRDAFGGLTTGGGGVAVGYFAGDGVTTGANNTAVGFEAMKTANSTLSVAIGRSALVGAAGNSPTSNVAIGVNAMYDAQTGASYSVAIGYAALENVTTGAGNVGIGHVALRNLTTGGGNVAIGYAVGSQLTTESNKLYIDNSNTTTPLIYGEFDNNIVRVNGELQVGDPSSTGFKFPTTDGSSNYVLKTDGSGNVTWAQVSGTSGLGAVGATGTPVDNQLAVWTDAKNIEGDANLTWDGSELTVAGSLRASTVEVNGRAPASPGTGAVGAGSKIITQVFVSGAVTAGDVYVAGSTAWAQGDADSKATSVGLIAVATDAATPAEMLIEGSVKLRTNFGFSSAAKGDVLYLSQSPGELTDDISGYTTGDFVRVCGYVIDASKNYIYFKPDSTWLEL